MVRLAAGLEHGRVYANVGGVTISDPDCYVTVGVMFWFAYSVVFFIHEIYIRRRKQWCLRLTVCHFQLCQGKHSFSFYGTFKISYFCVPQKKITQVWNNMRVSKWRQILLFGWTNYPFNILSWIVEREFFSTHLNQNHTHLSSIGLFILDLYWLSRTALLKWNPENTVVCFITFGNMWPHWTPKSNLK